MSRCENCVFSVPVGKHGTRVCHCVDSRLYKGECDAGCEDFRPVTVLLADVLCLCQTLADGFAGMGVQPGEVRLAMYGERSGRGVYQGKGYTITIELNHEE